MACDITAGRKVPCKDVVGGITRIWFVNFGDMGTVTQSADDEISDMTGTFSAYQYDLKGTSSLEQAINSSRDNSVLYVASSSSLFVSHSSNLCSFMAFPNSNLFTGFLIWFVSLDSTLRGSSSSSSLGVKTCFWYERSR